MPDLQIFDTLSFSDSLTVSLNQLGISVSDALQFSDSLSLGYPSNTSPSDNLNNWSDAVNVIRSGINVAELVDSLQFSWTDAVVITKHLRLQLGSNLNSWDDNLPLQHSKSVSVSDTLSMSDAVSVNTIQRISLFVSDLFALSDHLLTQSDSREIVNIDTLYYRRWLND